MKGFLFAVAAAFVLFGFALPASAQGYGYGYRDYDDAYGYGYVLYPAPGYPFRVWVCVYDPYAIPRLRPELRYYDHPLESQSCIGDYYRPRYDYYNPWWFFFSFGNHRHHDRHHY